MPDPATPAHPDPPLADPLHAVNSRARPSRGWYGLAFVLLLIGLSAYVASINVGRAKTAAMVQALQAVTVPGQATLTIDQPGTYAIFYEKVGTRDGNRFDLRGEFPVLPKMNLTLADAATGEEIPAPTVDSHTIYRTQGREGYSEWGFAVEQPTTIRIEAEFVNADPSGQRFQLTVGQIPVGELTSDWRGLFGGAAVLAFAFVISSVTLIVTWMLRHAGPTRRD